MTPQQWNHFSLLEFSPWSDIAELRASVPMSERLPCLVTGSFSKLFKHMEGKINPERKWQLNKKICESEQDGIDSFLPAPLL